MLKYDPDEEAYTELPYLLIVALYIYVAYSGYSGEFDLNTLYILLCLAYAICVVERAFVPLLYREDGIWTRNRFIKWQEIQSWHWEKEAFPKLVLKLDKRFSFFKEQELNLRKQHQPIVEELLQKHTSFARQSESTTQLQGGDADGC